VSRFAAGAASTAFVAFLTLAEAAPGFAKMCAVDVPQSLPCDEWFATLVASFNTIGWAEADLAAMTTLPAGGPDRLIEDMILRRGCAADQLAEFAHVENSTIAAPAASAAAAGRALVAYLRTVRVDAAGSADGLDDATDRQRALDLLRTLPANPRDELARTFRKLYETCAAGSSIDTCGKSARAKGLAKQQLRIGPCGRAVDCAPLPTLCRALCEALRPLSANQHRDALRQ